MAKYNYTQPANELQRFADMVEFPDAEPTENSAQLVTSGGVYDAIQAVEEEAKQLSYNSLMEDTASGSIASFPDGAEGVPVKELTADIEPIQDLHGQASPWPAGGSINKCNPTTAINGTLSNGVYTTAALGNFGVADLGITEIALAASTEYVLSFDAKSASGSGSLNTAGVRDSAGQSTGATTSQITWPTLSASYQRYVIKVTTDSAATMGRLIFQASQTASSLVVNITNIQFEVGSTAHDYVPYSNICPISGYTGAEITRTGKQLFDKTAIADSLFIQSNGVITGSSGWCVSDYIAVEGGADYILSGVTNTGSAAYHAFYDSNKALLSTVVSTTYALTAPANAKYVRLSMRDNSLDGVQFESGTTASPYEAYLGTVYSVSWSDHGTVYKGTAEYKGDGEWEISDIYGRQNLGSLTWNKSGTDGTFYVNNANSWIKFPATEYVAFNGLCDSYKVDSYENGHSAFGTIYTSWVSAGSKLLYIRDSAYADADAATFKTAMADKYLVYEKAAGPTTFTVSGPDPETLLGDNNIWSNTGDISVRYRCNTALYIEKKLGE